ncbi:MAG TPA: aminomethyl-transferring glycine dehydrogenase [Myxococcota bacterium]|nr:aminomethyl-transferring glycine dehydrogenase [Myxococcota bacterium]
MQAARPSSRDALAPSDTFRHRHIGPSEDEIAEMLARIGCASLDELVEQTVPRAIRLDRPLSLAGLGERELGEREVLARLREIASRNRVLRSCIGMGYADTIVPPVIQRNVLENPGWYTQYTPYQAEISQGRLEVLLAFQTLVADLTGLPLANASLLDEATAAAEAMAMCFASARGKRAVFLAANDCHPQTLGVVRTRAQSMGIELRVGPTDSLRPGPDCCGLLLQYPASDGRIADPRPTIARAHAAGALVVVAADPLALVLLTPPGELGADIAVGSMQRFGVPLGYGGPHAAYLATRDELARRLPGRLVGVSRDAHGRAAYRLAIQTREQHIRRDKATSTICTAQVLLAIMAGLYAVYHGPDGLRRIARRVRGMTCVLAEGLRRMGHELAEGPRFDTVRVTPSGKSAKQVLADARARGINLRDFGDESVGVALDETTTREDVEQLLAAFAAEDAPPAFDSLAAAADAPLPASIERRSSILTHPVFHAHRSEHEMLRYLHRLQAKDLSLTTSMIPLGSCTMKLNATSEMLPITWPEFSGLHPFAPADQARGYAALFADLESWLAEITGLPAVSLQPNAGSQGEYAGLLAIRRYHASRGEGHRDVCLIPVSAHGTNAASAVIAGFRVVAVACDERGNVELEDLRARCAEHAPQLAALMITYPSTHGVFEEDVRAACALAHEHGAQVYLDGANMNAQVGLTSPARIGADVCHLNLHKTFCIPHGGGGPGMGPIAAAKHLDPFLPGDPATGEGAVSAAPYGSAGILPIPWVYIALMGARGLTRATQVAILNANYMAARLAEHYEVVYRGARGRVAHEFIIDCRGFERSAGVRVEDVAKRLMDYGFHAPTMSFPVAGTLMIEPTESESKAELDRLCDALISIRAEVRAIERGELDPEDNPLRNAPHTVEAVASDEWRHPYTRQQAAWPAPWLHQHKYWPPVGRIDNAYGDRNLVCTCPPLEDLVQSDTDPT